MIPLIDFVKDFKHVARVNCSDENHKILVDLTDDYVFTDTGYRHKLFDDAQAALHGANITNTTAVTHLGLVNGKIPPKTVCPYRDRCLYAKSNTCGHLGVEHTVAYSCGAARAFRLDPK